MVSDDKKLVFLLFQGLLSSNILKDNYRLGNAPLCGTNRRNRTQHYRLASVRTIDHYFFVGNSLPRERPNQRKIPAGETLKAMGLWRDCRSDVIERYSQQLSSGKTQQLYSHRIGVANTTRG